MSTTQGQRVLAGELAEELWSCGHEIGAADVLDALASIGVSLHRDSETDAMTSAYQETVAEHRTRLDG